MSENSPYVTSAASSADWPEIRDFLWRRPRENGWAIRYIHRALCDWHQECESALVCRSSGRVAGALSLYLEALPGKSPYYVIYMDALNATAAESLAMSLPAGAVSYFRLLTRETQQCLEALPGASGREHWLYFTVTRERFRPVGGEKVVALTEADRMLFQGSGQEPRWQHMDPLRPIFAIVRDGKVACQARCGPFTPALAMRPQVWSISGLYTETPHRRQGLARRLVSHLTDLVLREREGNLLIYGTVPDNTASQRLCQGLGYSQYAKEVWYQWQRP
jgi:GNAT superfamily N-acetyltransferase